MIECFPCGQYIIMTGKYRPPVHFSQLRKLSLGNNTWRYRCFWWNARAQLELHPIPLGRVSVPIAFPRLS